MSHADTTKDLKKASCFLINKALETHIGSGSTVRRLRDGSLLIKVKNSKQAQLLASMQSLGGVIKVKVAEHATLNHCKGVIYCDDLRDLPEDEILEGLQSQKVTEVYKIKRKDKTSGQMVNTALCIITFKSSSIPNTMNVGFHRVHVDQYIPNPMKCLKCFKFGHTKKKCEADPLCSNCSQNAHEGVCNSSPKCINCNGEHSNLSRDCNRYKIEKAIQGIMTVDKISNGEARKKYKEIHPDFSYPTYASQANGIALSQHNNHQLNGNNSSQSQSTTPTHIYSNQNQVNTTQTNLTSTSPAETTTPPHPIQQPIQPIPKPQNSTQSIHIPNTTPNTPQLINSSQNQIKSIINQNISKIIQSQDSNHTQNMQIN